MPVYVDNARIPFGRMKMCHMLADTLGELHAMAARIGLRRRWFQSQASVPHYDVSLSKRQLAVDAGAVELDRRQMGQLVLRLRRESKQGEGS